MTFQHPSKYVQEVITSMNFPAHFGKIAFIEKHAACGPSTSQPRVWIEKGRSVGPTTTVLEIKTAFDILNGMQKVKQVHQIYLLKRGIK